MRDVTRYGLRFKLAAALVGVALLTAALMTLWSSVGIDSRIEAAARSRLDTSARHFSDVAANVYASEGQWSAAGLSNLVHLAEMDDLRIQLQDVTGETLVATSRAPSSDSQVPSEVVVDGRPVGRLVVAPANGQLFSPEEDHLRTELMQLHVISAVLAAAIALAAALLLAVTLARPLRRIAATARLLAGGRLDARVEPMGDEEIRAVGEALNTLAETLEREEALRKENVEDLAHELRTPVMGILARVEAAQDDVIDDKEANLAAIHDETLRLTHLLDDLSTLAEAQRPGLFVPSTLVDLGEVGERQAAAFAPRFDEAGLAFSCDCEPVHVMGDAHRLEQVAANLLSNALRYTDEGGRVSLKVVRSDGSALLEVSDSGVGIAQDDIPLVFTRFWRGEKSRSRGTGGAGIGLAIADELVKAHGGHVEVDSVVGEGSAFRVVLPVAGFVH